MASLLTTLGLRTPQALEPAPSSLAVSYMIFNFIFAHGVASSRFPKMYYGLDHQVSPREDLAKYGQKAVEKGTITQKQLNQLKRHEGAHANSVDHFPLFVGAMILAQVAGLPATEINFAGLAYTVSRMAYVASYIWIESPQWSNGRALLWWTSSIVCLRVLWKSGTAINARL